MEPAAMLSPAFHRSHPHPRRWASQPAARSGPRSGPRALASPGRFRTGKGKPIPVHQHAPRHWFGLMSSGSFMSRRRSHSHNNANDSSTTATAASITTQLYSDSSNGRCCHGNHICHNY